MLISSLKHFSLTAIVCFLLGILLPTAVVAEKPGRPHIAYLRETSGYWQVWLTDGSGANHRQLTFDDMDVTRVSWNKGRSSLFANRSDGRMISIDIDTGKTKLLDLPVKGMLDAQISKDGEWLAFSLISTPKMDTNNLWRVRVNGDDLQKLSNQGELQLLPSWSADGKHIVYTAGTSIERHEIWMLDIESGSQHQISQGRGYKLDPAIGADGAIVYSSNVSGADQYDLWLQSEQGAVPVQITHTWAVESEPAWSPDGKKLAYVAIDIDGKRIWIMDRNGKNAQPVTPAGAACRGPAWY